MCSITTFCLSLTVRKLLSFSFWLDLPIQGEILGVLGAGGLRNLNYGDFNPQKAHPLVIPSLLGVYALKSVQGFGQAAIPRKKRKKSHTRSIFGHISPRRGGAAGNPIGTKFGTLVGPLHLITPANFYRSRVRTGSVAPHESLLCFRFSALHRLSPLTQLGPAGQLVIKFNWQ